MPASESSRYCWTWAIRYNINLAASIFFPNDSEKLNLFLSTFNFQSKLVISFKLDPHHFLLTVGISNHFKRRQLAKEISMCYHTVMGLGKQIGISRLLCYQMSSFVCFCVFWQLWEVLHSMIHQILRILLCKTFHCFPCVLSPLLYRHWSEQKMPSWCWLWSLPCACQSWAWPAGGDGWTAYHVATLGPEFWAISLESQGGERVLLDVTGSSVTTGAVWYWAVGRALLGGPNSRHGDHDGSQVTPVLQVGAEPWLTACSGFPKQGGLLTPWKVRVPGSWCKPGHAVRWQYGYTLRATGASMSQKQQDLNT